MMRRILASRHFVAAVLAMTTGMVLFYTRPFPEGQLFLNAHRHACTACLTEFSLALQRGAVHDTLHALSRNALPRSMSER